jgi:hypothetical protein
MVRNDHAIRNPLKKGLPNALRDTLPPTVTLRHRDLS